MLYHVTWCVQPTCGKPFRMHMYVSLIKPHLEMISALTSATRCCGGCCCYCCRRPSFLLWLCVSVRCPCPPTRIHAYARPCCCVQVVERARGEAEESRGQMQATCYAIRFVGNVIGCLGGALLYNTEIWGWGLSFRQVMLV